MTQPTFIKNFLDWFVIKPRLNQQNHKPPLVKERDIFWCRIGENIGTEISGKGREFFRPVVIIKKLSKYTFMVVPTSTKIKEGSWYVNFVFGNKEMIGCLHQARVIDYRRLEDKMGTLSELDFGKIKEGFANLYQ